MKEIIMGMEVIKMYTWEKPFRIIIDAIRRSVSRRNLQVRHVQVHNDKESSAKRKDSFTLLLIKHVLIMIIMRLL